MITNWQKYQQFKYKPGIVDPDAMHEHVYDKDGNNIVDTAEKIEGLDLSGAEIKAKFDLIESFLNDLTFSAKIKKVVESIELSEDGQKTFELKQMAPDSIVEVRVHRTWLEEAVYTVKDNLLTLDNTLNYKKGKKIDVIYYQIGSALD